MKIDLRKVFVENITYFWKNESIFGKERPCINAYANAYSSSACVCLMHAYGYAGTYAQARIPKTRKERFSTLKLGLE